jgi:MinD-like ATPase involved in chromosome partitioning or flagellar assembly
MSPERYGQLVAFLGRVYELVLLDLGTALTEPLARFALERADALVVATPEWITSSTAVDSLHYQRLRTTPDSGTYACERLDGATRLAVTRLGLAVVARLV